MAKERKKMVNDHFFMGILSFMVSTGLIQREKFNDDRFFLLTSLKNRLGFV